MNHFSYTITPLGDSALLIHFGNTIDAAINGMVLSLFKQLQNASLPLIDLVPAYASLAIYFNSTLLYQQGDYSFEKMKGLVLPFLTNLTPANTANRKQALPVCYAGGFAPDLQRLAIQKKLSAEEVVTLHTATTYRVYMIGFLPGFAYMGKVNERIATPRKNTPVSVAAGSVGIAGEQTGIYPLASPGGWNIIGRTPVSLFHLHKEPPVLLQPGDEVTFYSITEDEFEHYKGGIA